MRREKTKPSYRPKPVSTTPMPTAWVYIITNKRNGTLYVGVTKDMARRAYEHKNGLVEGFSKKYGLRNLVYVEKHERLDEAIHREKCIKEWKRQWKLGLIEKSNPEWQDLSNEL
jgi:putative endonuclease